MSAASHVGANQGGVGTGVADIFWTRDDADGGSNLGENENMFNAESYLIQCQVATSASVVWPNLVHLDPYLSDLAHSRSFGPA